MVFSSVLTRIEPSTISQLSIYTLFAFSYLLHKWKKLLIIAFFLLTSIFLLTSKSHALAYFPGSCGTMCMANRNYYGPPVRPNYSYYPYANLPFHSMHGPSPYYFRPYGPSPYQPQGCITCMQRYQQFTQPWPSSGGMMFTQSFPSKFRAKIPFRL